MDPEAFDQLVYDMWYPDPARSQQARAKFNELGPEIRHGGLLRILQSDQDGMIWRAIYLLLSDDNDRFLPFVLPLFESNNRHIRWVTAAAFATWGFSGAIEPLKKLARSDPNAKVRGTAIRALGKCGSVAELEVLREFFTSTADDGNGWPLANTALEAARAIRARSNATEPKG